MTREQAEYVKQLRCLGCTYRAIAKHYGRKYADASEIDDNQLDGEWLVVEAALILVESDKAWDDAGKENTGNRPIPDKPEPLCIIATGWFVMYESARTIDGMMPAAFFYSRDEACDFILRAISWGLPAGGYWLEPGYSKERVEP